MKHLGDITKIDGYSVPIVDVVIGGSPCQDLSCAGKRKGLAGERSGLFMEQIRIIKEMRKHDEATGRTGINVRPRYLVWENVPGAMSSNSGSDFQAVLEEIAKVADENAVIPRPADGKWANAGCILADWGSVSWRILDAQFWGVPQRRRRIALVADFGGDTAPEILFVRKGVCGYNSESNGAEKSIAGTPNECVTTDDRTGEGLREGRGLSGGTGGVDSTYVVDMGGGKSGRSVIADGSPTLTCTHYGAPAVAYDGNREDIYSCKPGMMLRFSNKMERDLSVTLDTASGDNRTAVVLPDDRKANVVEIDRASYNMGKNAKYDMGIDEDGIAHTCIAKGPGAVAYGLDSYNQSIEEGIAQPLRSSEGGDESPKVVIADGNAGAVAFGISSYDSNAMKSSNPNSGVYEADTSRTLDLNGGNPACNQGGVAIVALEGNGQRPSHMGNGYAETDKSYTLNTTEVHGVAYHDVDGFDAYNQASTGDVAKPLTHSATDSDHIPIIRQRYVVRRLTPTEAERLQGFPDGWTDLGEWTDTNGKKHTTTDSARYKCLGNSIALPPWRWVLKRLCSHYERNATMASLFDGIGGFPLIWEQLNGKGTCIWASEIEEFPIAVTERRINGK